ncbi:MAG: proton-conducting membrane transporter [Clostridia bacterium]|nr:proton-conducting membrane transporter [Clostridia bacterium]
MASMIILLPIILPFFGSFIIIAKPFRDRLKMRICTMSIVLATMFIALYAIYFSGVENLTIYRFASNMSLAFRLDGLAKFYGTMVSILWTATTIYAFEYMSHEKYEQRFFLFFTMSFGVVLGIAFSANLLTLYLFYEFLTLTTLPLVMHEMDKKAYHAGKIYLTHMMGGASLAFVGLVIIICYSNNIDFKLGGVLNPAMVAGNENILRFTFLVAFFGFGVKAAIFPFYYWLPTASVAPTPVTALLHAVAVVKSGVFAIIRLTYFCYGIDLLRGSFAQNIMMGAALFTIVFGSTMALKTSHIKRRFAYSTMSNLSYIIFAVSIMTLNGLAGGLLHMLYHAVVKITIFFCAGAILVQTHREYVKQMEGLGTKMPIIFGCFTVAGFGLVGVPPFAGFHSKWNIAIAALQSANPLAYAGIMVLIISALLTALYVFTVVISAYFPKTGVLENRDDTGAHDPPKLMTLPIVALTVLSVVLGFMPAQLMQLLRFIISS